MARASAALKARGYPNATVVHPIRNLAGETLEAITERVKAIKQVLEEHKIASDKLEKNDETA